MRIKTMVLENFQGVKSLKIEAGSNDVKVFGENGTGKTTIANAYSFLLTGKAYTGEKDYSPKTVKGDDYLHNTEHSVEIEFELESGEEISLKKVYKEVWTKKRGRAEPDLTGNTVDHYIDGVPTSASDYANTVEQLAANPETVQVLTKPGYFAEELEWRKRRETLLSIAGGLSDLEILQSTPDLHELEKMLKESKIELTINEFKSVASAKKREANEKLKSIRERIDENQRGLAELVGNLEEAESEYELVVDQIASQKASQMASATEGEDVAAARAKVNDVTSRLLEARSGFDKEKQKRYQAKFAEVSSLNQHLTEVQKKMNSLEADQKIRKASIERMVERRAEILKQAAEINQSKLAPELTCPTCGTPYDEEKRRSIEEQFNLEKSKKLRKLQEDGKSFHKTIIAAEEKLYDERQQELGDLEVELIGGREELAIKQKELEQIQAEELDSQKLEAELKDLERQIAEGLPCKNIGMDELATQALEKRRSDLGLMIARFHGNKEIKKRDAELRAQMAEASKSYEAAEKALFLIEKFMQTKSDLLTEKINQLFQSVQVKLFKKQVNGAIEDCCEVLVPNGKGDFVPYQSANNAARINSGLEIIDQLNRAWGKDLPIFIDNAESVNELARTKAQQVHLLVSTDKKLRVEVHALRAA